MFITQISYAVTEIVNELWQIEVSPQSVQIENACSF